MDNRTNAQKDFDVEKVGWASLNLGDLTTKLERLHEIASNLIPEDRRHYLLNLMMYRHERLMRKTSSKPEFNWDPDRECWTFSVSDYIIVCYDPTTCELEVLGSLMQMEVTFDNITEERGIRFYDRRNA